MDLSYLFGDSVRDSVNDHISQDDLSFQHTKFDSARDLVRNLKALLSNISIYYRKLAKSNEAISRKWPKSPIFGTKRKG